MDNLGHRWKFLRVAGVDQVMFRSGDDIANLGTLDQKIWLALACPTHGLEFDSKTLEFVDTDKDGRIRAPEVLGAVAWLKAVLRNLDELIKGGDVVPLANLNDQTPAGAALLLSARQILADGGKPEASVITVAEAADSERRFVANRFNGDGVVPAESAGEAETRQVIEDILRTHGSIPDRSGAPGINRAKVDAFFAEARLYVDWLDQAVTDQALCPLGPDTGAVATAVMAVKAKVDDYFTRCRLAAFDSRAGLFLNGSETEYKLLAEKTLSSDVEQLARLPLAHIEANRALPLTEGVNPAWAAALTTLQAGLQALLGKPLPTLTESDWNTALSKLTAYHAWSANMPSTAVAALGPERIRAILTSPAHENLDRLIQQDAAQEEPFNQLTAVYKVVLFQRDFVKLLNNFVNFTTFYRKQGAIFQAGTLYLDGRSCELCVRVDDAARHALLAGQSRSYLAYCDCVRPGGEKLAIAAAFTGGDADYLMVGRNGVFYDRQGRDWDATITRVSENPISIRQAFWAPYKNFLRMIEAQVAKRAAAAEAEANAKLQEAAAATAHADAPKPGVVKPEPPTKIDIGTVAAIGVAVGGLATFLTGLLAIFFGLGVWMPLGFGVLVLAISGPSMLIAWLKLRQRNLGPILDANGWAINGRVKINVPFGGALTSVATLPRGAQRLLRDPYAEKKSLWRFYLVLLVVIALGVLWTLGRLDRYLPAPVKSTAVRGYHALLPHDQPPSPANKEPNR